MGRAVVAWVGLAAGFAAIAAASCSLDPHGEAVGGGGAGGSAGDVGGASGSGGRAGASGSAGRGGSRGTGSSGTAGTAGTMGTMGAGGSTGMTGGGGTSGGGGPDASDDAATDGGPDDGSDGSDGAPENEGGVSPACRSCLEKSCTKAYDACVAETKCWVIMECLAGCIDDGGGSTCTKTCSTPIKKADGLAETLRTCATSSCSSACDGL